MIPLLVPDLPSTDEILPWLRQIDNNHWYSNYGPLCLQFEKELVKLIQQQNQLSTNSHTPNHFAMVSTCSGTTALEVGLSAYRLRPGTRVVLPSLTFPATATAVIRSGLIPVLADVDPDSWLLTPEIAEPIVKKSGAKVVVPVSAYGQTVDEQAWQNFAEENHCQVLIDAAGAFPGQTPRSQVDVAYSFHATKSLGIGEGGGLLSTDENYLQVARELTNFGFSEGAVSTIGMNAKLSEYHAAVGLCQIRRFDQIKQKRNGLFKQMRKALHQRGLPIVYQSEESPSSPTLFVVAIPGGASDVCEYFRSKDIGVRQWYCPPLHLHPAFASYIKSHSLRFGPLIQAEQLSHRLIGLPFHPRLSSDNIQQVADVLADALAINQTHGIAIR